MPIPCKMNPFGKSNKPTAFELVVKPGILASTMDFSLASRWDSGGYCSVDWGDGNSERLSWGTAKTHSYAVAGTYKIRIQAECTLLTFTPRNLLYDCSNNWDILSSNGANAITFDNCPNAIFTMTTLPESMTDGAGLFWGSGKAQLPLKYLPKGLVRGADMFYGCSVATLPLTSLPDGLTNGERMFYGCTNATLPLMSLPDGLTNGDRMFEGCANAQLPLTSLPEGLTTGIYMFRTCNNAKLAFTKLPDTLTDCTCMFRGAFNTEMVLTSLPEGLITGQEMFNTCNATIQITKLPLSLSNATDMFRREEAHLKSSNVEINLDTLVANAPEEGWTNLRRIDGMFFCCNKVTGSRSAFLAKCPNVTSTADAFTGTNTTE